MLRRPQRFLGVTKRIDGVEENITRIELEHGVSAGIRWRSIADDMIPIFEEHSARSEKGISMTDWYKMEPMERAMIVAIRRVENASKNLQAEAEIKANKAKQQRK